jgi:hypothetical protein
MVYIFTWQTGKSSYEIPSNKATIYFNLCTVQYGAHQSSLLDPLHFPLYINDLPLNVHLVSSALLFSDSSIIITEPAESHLA